MIFLSFRTETIHFSMTPQNRFTFVFPLITFTVLPYAGPWAQRFSTQLCSPGTWPVVPFPFLASWQVPAYPHVLAQEGCPRNRVMIFPLALCFTALVHKFVLTR